MNFIDRAVAVFNPLAGLKRQMVRQQLNIRNTGYSHHGASKQKKSMKGWISKGGSVKDDIEDNLKTLRERSRDLYMGAPVATSAIKTTKTNVVGSGLVLKASIDEDILKMTKEEARAWEQHVEREFRLWSESLDCDAERMNNFYALQQIAFMSMLMSGDSFAVLPLIKRLNMPYDLRVKLIEADRCSNPSDVGQRKISSGVEYSDWGEVVAYHFLDHHPLASKSGPKTSQRIEKFGSKSGRTNVIHLMDAERPEQRRGVPLLAPVIETVKQLARYHNAELDAAVISAFFTVFIESPAELEDDVPEGGFIDGNIDESDRINDSDYNGHQIEMGSGAIVGLADGQKATFANPSRPNTGFEGFVNAICRQIGSAVEIPHELLLKQFTASYSASRASLLEAWKMFRMRRTHFANDFCQPIYVEFLVEGIANGRITAPGFFEDPIIKKAYCGAQWNGPSQGQLDPLKEVNAAEKRVQSGFSTRAREAQELTSTDFVQNVKQRIYEETLMKEGGLTINGEAILEVQELSEQDS